MKINNHFYQFSTIVNKCGKFTKTLYLKDFSNCEEIGFTFFHFRVFNIFPTCSQCGLFIHLLSTFEKMWKIVENSAKPFIYYVFINSNHCG